MDRHDFISRIISMYPHVIKDNGIEAYYDMYKRNIQGKEIDFDKLFSIFATEHKGNYPPEGKEIGEMARRCIKNPILNTSKWLQVKVFNPLYNCVTCGDCFPSGTTRGQMLDAYKKKFPNIEGFKIIEVYLCR